ncbi:NADH dehydrogenase [ubiquinone] 1 alpha subcomplex subunit 12 [Cocos nucifera]|uniref:NADH dehydrogenase [ubiquinone] 1 alpha subcomplex subunit 12 n=1 Tax=Cocos nucifera TaxID=13894 RepID=A0A8K0I632_COCNU|nr:NADH dehydrogenase [ubiquinone] 1 alpha subcomplex subunit 12 [Cocos nucifera]
MSKILSKLWGFFSSRTMVGIDKFGNRYFTRKEEIDGALKDKRWVVFKGEEDPTTIPVEWICWLNGQRKKAPTPEEMIELAARRERVRQNVTFLKKKEEAERKSLGGVIHQRKSISKGGSPDLKSFIQQFPGASFDHDRGFEEVSDEIDGTKNKDRSSEPTGSGESFKPGTWQPPT